MYITRCDNTALGIHVTRRLYFNPMNPFQDGAVSCENVTRPLRVFYGQYCDLWKKDNPYNCSWNAMQQVFEGSNCTNTGPTQCMCRHLTGARGPVLGCPNFTVPSPADSFFFKSVNYQPSDGKVGKIDSYLSVVAQTSSQYACRTSRWPHRARC